MARGEIRGIKESVYRIHRNDDFGYFVAETLLLVSFVVRGYIGQRL